MTWKSLTQKITKCERCPRLRQYCRAIAEKKRRQYLRESYWGRPVPGFGDPRAPIWIIGLAPGAHGANRTGRMFTGDSSGDWLYGALYQFGFASQPSSTDRNDGMKLHGVYISAAARCAPPDNKPSLLELRNCSQFLDQEFLLLDRTRIFLGLGKIGFESILHVLKRQGVAIPTPTPKFSHGATYYIGDYTLLASYHPSRQNTQTGRLTQPMWLEIFKNLKTLNEA
ncbi:MAG: uracil-DNA glycosylase [Proteobacteria bacterium]|nr:uracil-DNA glycosylase [Pseudomonadota bacterium]NBY20303.1 uracil-DNA glycosylase [bacterium]